MEKVIQFLTNTQSDAYTVVETLKKMDETDDVSLSEVFVIEKDENGKSQLKNSEGQVADNAIFGTLMGGVIGLLAGPAGALMGGTLGLLTGSLLDLGKASDTDEYLDNISKNIPNGKCLVVAHVFEEWETPIDTKLSGIATITRINVDDEVDKAIEADIDAMDKAIAKTNAEIKQSVGDKKEELQKKLEELKAKREAKNQEMTNRMAAQKKAYKKWFKKLKAKLTPKSK